MEMKCYGAMPFFDLQIFYFSSDSIIIAANIHPPDDDAGSHPSRTQQNFFDSPENDKGLHSWEETRHSERQD